MNSMSIATPEQEISNYKRASFTTTGSSSRPSSPKMYEPMRRMLNFRHIEQINTLTFNNRELSRNVTSLYGMVPVAMVAQIRSLNARIMESIDSLEQDLARNERASYEAKVEYYYQEYQEMQAVYQRIIEVINNPTTDN